MNDIYHPKDGCELKSVVLGRAASKKKADNKPAAPSGSASSPAPETDAAIAQYAHHLPNWLATEVMGNMARRMERERDHWKNVAENATQDHAQADTDSIRALHERNDLRDALTRLLDAVTLRMSADEPTPGERMELLRAWEAAGKLIPQNARAETPGEKGTENE